MSTTWIRATSHRPCPICSHSDWCAESPDGTVVHCMRVESKHPATGGGWTHRHPSAPPAPRPAVASPSSITIADVVTRDAVYRSLLRALPLQPEHRGALERRGLSASAIASNLYGSMPASMRQRLDAAATISQEFSVETLVRVPGFAVHEGRLSLNGSAGIIIPAREADGRIHGMQIRADEPGAFSRYQWLGKGRRGGVSAHAAPHVPLSVSRRFTDLGLPPWSEITITEGLLKADVAADLSGGAVIGVPGFGQWAHVLPVVERLAPKRVLVAFDVDADPVTRANVASATASLLARLRDMRMDACAVTWDASQKGLDDALLAGLSVVVQSGEPEPPVKLPAIQTHDRPLRNMVRDAEIALLEVKRHVYTRASSLVWVTQDDHGARIMPHSTATLRLEMSHSSDYLSERETQIVPPHAIVESVLANPATPFPVLDRVTPSPVIARDGSIRTQPGYDPQTRMFYAPPGGFVAPVVPEEPSAAQVAEAVEALDVMLRDFPFVGEASRAHTMSLILLLFVRHLIDGRTPMYMFDAPTIGTGKSLIAQVACSIYAGAPPPTITEAHDDDEWRKRITAVMLRGSPVVFIDNVSRRLEGGSLAALLTSSEWSDRALGESRQVILPNHSVLVATGNNMRTSDELSRRCVWIWLNSGVERPWLRTGFAIKDLQNWALANRSRLVGAVLTILRGWVRAGSPESEHTLGSFEAWSRTMGGILAFAGVTGFLANADAAYATADEQSEAWRAFVGEWWERHQWSRVGVNELWEIAANNDILSPVIGDGNEQSRHVRFGKALSRCVNRTFRGYRIEQAPMDAQRRKRYCLAALPPISRTDEAPAQTSALAEQPRVTYYEETFL